MASPTNTFIRARAPEKVPVQTYTGASDALDISRGDIHILNRSGDVNAATLTAPTDSDEGRTIWVLNGTTQANTIDVSGGLGGAGGSHNLITFTNVAAANVTLRAYGQQWYLTGSYAATVS